MNSFKSYLLATMGIVCLAASLTLNGVRADNETVTSSTAHFKFNKTYLFTPANGTGQIKCRVSGIDGAWVACHGYGEWFNTNAMASAMELHETDTP